MASNCITVLQLEAMNFCPSGQLDGAPKRPRLNTPSSSSVASASPSTAAPSFWFGASPPMAMSLDSGTAVEVVCTPVEVGMAVEVV